jgi:mono/diheme cytochrome c family protein
LLHIKVLNRKRANISTMNRMFLSGVALLAMACALPAHADPAAVERGLRLAQANCTPCHAIGAVGDSPNTFAPRFRDLGQRLPGLSMEEIFARALLVGHPDMPRFGMRDRERDDILAYVATVRQAGASQPEPTR